MPAIDMRTATPPGYVIPLSTRPDGKNMVKPGSLTIVEVRCEGNRRVIKINGKIVHDITDPANTFRKGHITLQQLGTKGTLRVRKFEIKELPAKREP